MTGWFFYQDLISTLGGERGSLTAEQIEQALSDARSLLTQWWVTAGMKVALEYYIANPPEPSDSEPEQPIDPEPEPEENP